MTVRISSVESDVRSALFCIRISLSVVDIEFDEAILVSYDGSACTSVCYKCINTYNKRQLFLECIGINKIEKFVFTLSCGDQFVNISVSIPLRIRIKYVKHMIFRRHKKYRQAALESLNFKSIPLFQSGFTAHIDSIKLEHVWKSSVQRIVGWACAQGYPVESISLSGGTLSHPFDRIYRDDVSNEAKQSFGVEFILPTDTQRTTIVFRQGGEAVGLIYLECEYHPIANAESIQSIPSEIISYLAMNPIEISTPVNCQIGLDHTYLYNVAGAYVLEVKGWFYPHQDEDVCCVSSEESVPLLFDRYFRQDVCTIFATSKNYGFSFFAEIPALCGIIHIHFRQKESRCTLLVYPERIDIQHIDETHFTTAILRGMGNLDYIHYKMDNIFIAGGWMYSDYTIDSDAIISSTIECSELAKVTRLDLMEAFPEIPGIQESGFSLFLHKGNSKCAVVRIQWTDIDIIFVANLHEIMSRERSEYYKSMSPELKETLSDIHSTMSRLNKATSCFIQQSDEYVQINDDDIKYIAFYLPQYHPFPENDKFWGVGFTEWTNVTRATPLFNGHYQPRLPADLGFYDLRLPEVQRKQAEIANQYGIYGMCYYCYWFDGKAIMDTPLKNLLANKDIPQRFCLCWANENWSRRWDGQDCEILLSQNHSPEDDILFMESILPALTDERYIKVDGKPMLLLYRPGLIPNVKATIRRWRSFCVERNVGKIHIVGVIGFGYSSKDADADGFDAALESQPQNMHGIDDVSGCFKTTFPRSYEAAAYDLPKFLHDKRHLQGYSFPTYKCAFTEWDNTARRGAAGTVFLGCSPELYRSWLEDISSYTLQSLTKQNQFVFINAWNEWAEGAYLEPDRKYGYAYLDATKRALLNTRESATLYTSQKNILVWGHDAYPHGAQFNLLAMITHLKEHFYFNVFLFLEDMSGSLLAEYQEVATVVGVCEQYDLQLEQSLKALYNDKKIRSCLTNTTLAGSHIQLLKRIGYRVVSLIHEMEDVIRTMKMEKRAAEISKYSDKVVFASSVVAKSFQNITHLKAHKRVICPQGSYMDLTAKHTDEEMRARLRALIGTPNDAYVILNVGYLYHRKGGDLFIKAALQLLERRNDVFFVWVGPQEAEYLDRITEGLTPEQQKHFRFTGNDRDVGKYYHGADIFWLTSREDPFPTVVMEAMLCGVPVVGFEGAGGFIDIVTPETGRLVPYLDCIAMADITHKLLNDRKTFQLMCKSCASFSKNRFSYHSYVYDILDLLGYHFEKVSVIVPNYNYAGYLPGRLASIMKQTYPVYEVIILDDCSSDDSVKVIQSLREEYGIRIKPHFSDENSGNPYIQWVRGLRLAKGGYVWIAEADDLCKPLLLERNISALLSGGAILAYCESCAINETNKVVMDNYRDYNHEVCPGKWDVSYCVEGVIEIQDSLAIRNSILNASACLFKNVDISPIADELISMRIAGDWRFYTWLLEQGKIAYCTDVLNMHRRHTGSVTSKLEARKHFDEITAMQDKLCTQWKVPQRTREQVLQYRKELQSQLNLNQC